MEDTIIIGGGPAGLTAAIYAARAGVSLLLLEGGELGGQVAVSAEVENYPAVPRTTGFALAERMARQVQDMGVPVRRETVEGIADRGGEKQVFTGQGIYTARTLILANGARRRKLGCPGEEALLGRGVSYCAACDGAFFRDREVAVAGGGNTAVEDAVYLSGLCRAVHLIFRRPRLTAQQQLVKAARARENLTLHPLCRITAIQGAQTVEGLRLEQVETGETWELPVEGVFIAIGLAPDNGAFAPPVALDEQGYIRSSEDCTTNLPGVFCAGDTRAKPLRQIVTAAADGAVAAMQAERYLAGRG